MLQAINLSIEFNKKIFHNLNFLLGNKEKVGLIGFNGAGKSTLLKIISNELEPDSGQLRIESEEISYLPQEYNFEKGILVGEILESLVENPQTELFKITKILNLLKFEDVDWYQEAITLSPGQKMKLYLAKLLGNEPTILLLDEPTNHLDIFGILWLENFIKKFKGICMIVSHDRAFLNNVCNKIFEIDEEKLNIFEGNYDDYLIQKEDLLEKRAIQLKLQEKKREKFENMIVQIKKQSAGEAQARALKAARSRMEREVTRVEIDSYKEKKIKDLQLSGGHHSSKQILKIKNLNFGYSADELLLENAELNIYGKEKLWFFGANGIGKSTLIKLITGELKPNSGEIKIGDNIRYNYFSQDQSHLDFEKSAEEYFLDETGMSYSQSFGVLDQFMFDKELRKVLIRRLSPGQRARLSFAIFAQKEYDFLILDEPTNHLDIKSKEVIENALREYKGSMLLISHDRYFVENIGFERAVTIEDRQVKERFL